jgi:hypothetical protein
MRATAAPVVFGGKLAEDDDEEEDEDEEQEAEEQVEEKSALDTPEELVVAGAVAWPPNLTGSFLRSCKFRR